MKYETVVYEVNLEVDREIACDFRLWLDEHVARIVALPGFERAEIFIDADVAEADRPEKLSVRYRLDSKRSLDLYLQEHAPAMRADGINRFGDKFRARRRILLLDGLIEP